MSSPPDGSKITIDFEDGCQRIVIPQKPGGFQRWFFACFGLCFLVIWIAAMTRSRFDFTKDVLGLFEIFGLAVWMLGATMQIWTLYRMLRPAVPEMLILAKHEMRYDSGVVPLQYPISRKSQSEYWRKMFQRRVKASFGPEQVKTLKLRDFEAETRLTIDLGNKRIDIAAEASEPEREWLFAFLCQFYNIASEQKMSRSQVSVSTVVERLSRRENTRRARRSSQECPYCHIPTHIETEGDQEWQQCDQCGWSCLIEK